MAGGNLSPRQKMINLMYLIFIAMLALNMSKEVLSAFGLMNEKLTESNQATSERNSAFMASLEQKAEDQPEKYVDLKSKAAQIDVLATKFDSYLETLKGKMVEKLDDPTDYEVMDKGDYLDENFFKGDKLKPEGEEFLAQIAAYRDGVVKILAGEKGMQNVIKDVKEKFNTDKVTNRDGIKQEWLSYHYKGFPLVASLTKMTQLQADIKTTESEVLSTMLAGELSSQVAMTNYTTLMQTSKSAYFNGEQFDGQIVLGRTDASTKPSRVELTLDGRKLTQDKDFTLDGGKVMLKVGTGSVGEHKIEGSLFFLEDGKETAVPVKSSFATVAKPNAATISADKMNVVYRGVQNPMTISFAGIADNNVNASAQGLSRVSGSKYVMDATRIQGREVTINVTGKIDGQSVSDKATFRIKDLPKPTGTIRGEDGSVKMQRNALEISTVGAKFDDFDFELPLNVTGFKFKVPGQPTIDVNGSKLDSRAKSALLKAKRGDDVQIFDIEAKASGVSVILKKVSPIIIEITN
ncbi:gliding motility protein GldM [Mariniflexile gromovii]|uniref:Gliding motility protein GldM n=1 Tax=Mariniflexile gromovii TaxID=362523 RepID=A0ABS4BSX5_9FLAO|nr:gliding motility protein GldM [Mariniflexile gromovii]MBP0903147.1 gliding motility protein GldM [Mariniflexile gromovii]